jgi:manganese-dependent inorganic pyrophosphatase
MSDGELLVIGHRNPDTDAICSAIAYADFKRRTGWLNAEAARCGDTNERIDFVLQTFGVPAPRFVPDVSPRIRDVMQHDIVSVPPSATVVEALSVMDEKGIRVLPILDEETGICRGLVSVFKMVKFFSPASNRAVDSRRVSATVANIARTLEAEMIWTVKADEEDDLILMVGAMNADSFAKRLAQYPHEKLVVIVGDRRKIQSLAIHGRVRMVIVTGGLAVDDPIVEAAKKHGVSLIISPHDTATTATLCRTAICVRHMMHERFLTFREDELLADVEAVAAASTFQAFPVVDHQRRTVGVLSKSDFLKKINRRLILVDHNELSQAVEGADQLEIIEIIDHHRIGSLTTSQPILFRNEPVGSTSTIVADCYFRHRVELTPSIAGLLLAGLVSDTLNLTSPTTTERDAEILRKLEEISGVKANEFIERLFASGSLLTSLPPDQAILADCKEFEEDGRVFSVAQIEELGFDQFWKGKTKVVAALENYRGQKNYFFSALLITDVVRNTSLLLVSGPLPFLKAIDYPALEAGIFELKDVVSRKKQLLPYLTHCLRKGPAGHFSGPELATIV